MSEEFPPPPEGVELTPEEWDAVRRLRGERANEPQTAQPEPPSAESPPAPESPAAEPPAAEPPAAEPPAADAPVATAEPLRPVEPTPPPEETAPPVQEATSVPEATSVEAVAPPPPAAAQREGSPLSAAPGLAALAVLAVVAAVLAALVGLKVSDRHDRDRASTAALSAATTGVSTVLSYNYRSLDHDFAQAEALLTPTFRKAYLATTAKAVQPLAAKYKAVSTAQVSAAGVISATSSRAVVLVFVSQQVTNTQLSAPRLDRSRIQVELVHTHGTWLINKLNPI